ncbi:glycosyl hydrolase [uncultured Imperialibacter sp.]|uniref:glycosyl hydrolase n=1 Tax=uncultured Imperialibacter sp. TaxID=1672639 RepID=UPI0030D95A13
MRMLLLIVIAFVAFSCSSGMESGPRGNADYDRLVKGFQNPPTEARPKVYWWWLNGYVDTLRLREELRAIKEIGLGGVDVFEIGVPASENVGQAIPAGPAFMGPEFLETLKVVVDEARKLELEVGMNLASSWNAGGSWTKPEHAAKTIYMSKVKAHSGSTRIKVPFPTIPKLDPRGRTRVIKYGDDGKPEFRREIAVLAIPKEADTPLDTTRIVNVSAFFDSEADVLSWVVPEGEWEIHRYVCANSGEQLFMPSAQSVGPIIDHYDSSATRAHLEFFVDQIRPLVDDFATSPIKYFYLASYEAKDFAWSTTLPESFRRMNGYDIAKFLPLLFDNSLFDKELVERFQFDLRMTLSELMINNHYRKAKEISNSYGLKIASEAGGPGVYTIPVEALKALGSLDIPRGEFWHRTTRVEDGVDIIWLVKEIAAASHIYKRGIVEEEAFTSFINDWQEGPADLKPLADKAFAEGMNRVVIHGFTHNPNAEGVPGIGYFAGTHFNPKSGWWKVGRPFVDYLSRISYVLQQTDFVADVLYYYGDDVPNLVPPKNTRFKVGDGYDYEIINKEILLGQLTVENDKLVLPGVGSYHALYIGGAEASSYEVLEKLAELASKGAIVLGEKPVRTAGLSKDNEIEIKLTDFSDKVWAQPGTNVRSEEGKIYSGILPIEALKQLNVPPDFSYPENENSSLDYIHYRKDGLDFYLVRNTTDQWVNSTCRFRQENKSPEIWDPTTGEIAAVRTFEEEGGQVSLPLSLPPHGAQLVCFTPQKSKAEGQPLPDLNNVSWFRYESDGIYVTAGVPILTVDKEWTVKFPKGWGAPDSMLLPGLEPLTNSDIPGVKYFSGTASYTTSFDFRKGNNEAKIVIQLGDVSEVAEVWLNGHSLGISWTPPFQYDITDKVIVGKNELRVDITNNWSNRLVGDAITGEKFTTTNIKVVNRTKKLGWEHVPLVPSGLIGPVEIYEMKAIR